MKHVSAAIRTAIMPRPSSYVFAIFAFFEANVPYPG